MAGFMHAHGMDTHANSMRKPGITPFIPDRPHDLALSAKRPSIASDTIQDLGGFDVRDTESVEAAGPDLASLQAQNVELARRVATLEKQLKDALAQLQLCADQQGEDACLLEEKSELIRELHLKVQQLEENQPASRPDSETPESDLLALSEELERERLQLKQDEEVMFEQMRDMEIHMSRERAELARQKAEIERMQSEFNHHLETASRESTLRLQPFLRRQQESPQGRSAPAARPQRPTTGPAPSTPVSEAKPNSILRRMFGG